MATHRPLVVVDGAVQQLPVGDAVVGASGGGGSTISTGVVTIDFGAAPGSNEAIAAVTGATGITESSAISLWVSLADSTVDHGQNDHRYFAALCAFTPHTVVPGSGFDLYATSIHKLTGTFKVRYSWSA